MTDGHRIATKWGGGDEGRQKKKKEEMKMEWERKSGEHGSVGEGSQRIASAHRALKRRTNPVTMFKTPFGRPARSPNSARARAVKGVNSDGFTTMVQPAASAAPALRVIIAAGKFHGVMAAATPIGA